MEFKELIEKRRSIRKFSDRAVPRETVDRILRETLTAPSARNTRTTRLMVVDDPALVARMAEMRDYGSAFMKGAPLAFVVLGDTSKSDLWRENAAISATLLQLACVDEDSAPAGCISTAGRAARMNPTGRARPITCAVSCPSRRTANPSAPLRPATPTSRPLPCPTRTTRRGSSAFKQFFRLQQNHVFAQHVDDLRPQLQGVDRLGHVAVESALEHLLFVGSECERRHGDDRDAL